MDGPDPSRAAWLGGRAGALGFIAWRGARLRGGSHGWALVAVHHPGPHGYRSPTRASSGSATCTWGCWGSVSRCRWPSARPCAVGRCCCCRASCDPSAPRLDGRTHPLAVRPRPFPEPYTSSGLAHTYRTAGEDEPALQLFVASLDDPLPDVTVCPQVVGTALHQGRPAWRPSWPPGRRARLQRSGLRRAGRVGLGVHGPVVGGRQALRGWTGHRRAAPGRGDGAGAARGTPRRRGGDGHGDGRAGGGAVPGPSDGRARRALRRAPPRWAARRGWHGQDALIAGLAIAGGGFAATAGSVRPTRPASPVGGGADLYQPPGRALRVAALGYHGLLADVIWVRTVLQFADLLVDKQPEDAEWTPRPSTPWWSSTRRGAPTSTGAASCA